MQSALKRNNTKIPISQIVDILYIPTGTHCHALVASTEFTEQVEGNLVYVESGSQHGMLGLLDIPKELATGLPNSVNVNGHYDRDSATREK